MIKNTPCIVDQRGFTIVEVMVAIAVSMILILGIITIFSSTKHGYNTSQSNARLQENVRYAVTRLSSEIRQAGFIGCQNLSNTNTLNSSTNWLENSHDNIYGYEGTTATIFPTEFTGIDTTSDAIVIYRADTEKAVGYNSSVSKTKFTVNTTSHGFQAGDIIVINNCKHTAITQITEISGADITHAKDIATYSPKNCVEGLGSTGGCTGLDSDYSTWDSTTKVMPLLATAYYIAPSSVGPDKSLYRIRGTNSPEELVEGIESMQILYGEDTDADDIANRYVRASDVTNFLNIVSVRIGMLFSSAENAKQKASSRTYQVVDTSITTSVDKKIRHLVNMTIKLRNLGKK